MYPLASILPPVLVIPHEPDVIPLYVVDNYYESILIGDVDLPDPPEPPPAAHFSKLEERFFAEGDELMAQASA